MKILYAGKNINHHQVPFVESLAKKIGVNNIRYASLKMIEQERLKMGFAQFSGDLFIDINNSYQEFLEWWFEADIVVTNIRHYYDLMEQRLEKGKILYYTSERWFKKPIGTLRLLNPNILKLSYKYRKLSDYQHFYYLPQGYFAYRDFKLLGICKDKSYSFGYITPQINNSIKTNDNYLLPQDRINILWAGSLIKLKNVDILAKAFVEINKRFPSTYLTIIGEGPERARIAKILSECQSQNCYCIKNFVENSQLRSIMAESDIYVFPSNGAEGWGAVVNEAMSEGCAVVLASNIGARTLISHRFNGLVFQDGSVTSLIKQITELISNPDLLKQMKINAQATICNEWNSDTAADRFLHLCDSLRNNAKYNDNGFTLLKHITELDYND